MKKKGNILFVIPDGVGIRNYIYSSLIDHIKKRNKIFFWTTLPDEAIQEVEELHEVKITHSRFSLPKETVLTRLFRESATYARLLNNAKLLENTTILSNWNKTNSNIKLRILYLIAKMLGNYASRKYNRILIMEGRSLKNWNRKAIDHYKEKLVEISPASIFITHQRVAFLNPICIAAAELNIPINTCIYSWDNTAKASLAIRADYYLVWSDYMKRELSLLYPELDQENIIVTGTPQFEFYFQEERKVTREEFSKTYDLNSDKKWICFSGDDEKTSPWDPLYLKDLAESVLDIDKKKRPHIIFRRCPVDVSNRFDEVLSKFSDIITPIEPVWNTDRSSWGAVFPKQEDISLLVNIAYHCELVINVGSTMSHDFAVYNKPCFFINYDQMPDKNWSVDTIYKFQHFRSMGDLDGVGWLNDKNEIKGKISQVLFQETEIAKDKKKWMEVIVKHPLQDNACLIAKQLMND